MREQEVQRHEALLTMAASAQVNAFFTWDWVGFPSGCAGLPGTHAGTAYPYGHDAAAGGAGAASPSSGSAGSGGADPEDAASGGDDDDDSASLPGLPQSPLHAGAGAGAGVGAAALPAAGEFPVSYSSLSTDGHAAAEWPNMVVLLPETVVLRTGDKVEVRTLSDMRGRTPRYRFHMTAHRPGHGAGAAAAATEVLASFTVEV